MNEEQRKFFSIPFEQREEVFFQMFPEGRELKEKLLKAGGNRIAWRPESPLQLIEKGEFFFLNNPKIIKGEIRRCHYNTAKLFLSSNADIAIATGFALNKDVWIEHTWGCEDKNVIETTSLFNAYYGVILSGIDITKFVVSELKEEIENFPRELLIKKLPIPEEWKLTK